MQQDGCRLAVEKKRMQVATGWEEGEEVVEEEEDRPNSRQAAVVDYFFAPGRWFELGTFAGAARDMRDERPAGLSRDPP